MEEKRRQIGTRERTDNCKKEEKKTKPKIKMKSKLKQKIVITEKHIYKVGHHRNLIYIFQC